MAVEMRPMFREVTIGDCRLINADCRDVLPTLSGIDAVMTDPPYGIGINRSHRLSTSRGHGGESWGEKPCDPSVLAWILKQGNAVIWGGNYFDLPPTKCVIVWDKVNDDRDFADFEMAWTNL